MCPAEDPASAHQPATPPMVLVVEDEVILRLSLASDLRECGFRVVEAGNGGEAQTLILGGLKPDLVFADIKTPGMDGLALARWLEESDLDVPIVMTSGLQSSLDAAKAACANVSLFVTKPYDHQRLAGHFRTLLAARG